METHGSSFFLHYSWTGLVDMRSLLKSDLDLKKYKTIVDWFGKERSFLLRKVKWIWCIKEKTPNITTNPGFDLVKSDLFLLKNCEVSRSFRKTVNSISCIYWNFSICVTYSVLSTRRSQEVSDFYEHIFYLENKSFNKDCHQFLQRSVGYQTCFVWFLLFLIIK